MGRHPGSKLRLLDPAVAGMQHIMQVPVTAINLHLGPVHTYTDTFETATFSFRIRLPSTCIQQIRWRIRNFFNVLSTVDIFKSAMNKNCVDAKSGNFLIQVM